MGFAGDRRAYKGGNDAKHQDTVSSTVSPKWGRTFALFSRGGSEWNVNLEIRLIRVGMLVPPVTSRLIWGWLGNLWTGVGIPQGWEEWKADRRTGSSHTVGDGRRTRSLRTWSLYGLGAPGVPLLSRCYGFPSCSLQLYLLYFSVLCIIPIFFPLPGGPPRSQNSLCTSRSGPRPRTRELKAQELYVILHLTPLFLKYKLHQGRNQLSCS